MVKVNIDGAVILKKTKMVTNQVENAVDINTLLDDLSAQNHLQMLYQQARGNTGFQEEFQSEDKGNAEEEENDYITESESTLQSYCSREKLPTLETTNYQTSSRQVDSW